MKRALAKADIAAIVALKYVAYGNTKYDSATDTFTCQHGAGECESDALELCNQYLISGDMNSINTGDTSMAAWPFTLCMEEATGDPTAAPACYAAHATNSSIPYTAISDCATNQFNAVTTAAMKATPSDHQYVPWVLVGGELLDNTNQLVKAICAAYTGPPPASCRSLEMETEERCYKV